MKELGRFKKGGGSGVEKNLKLNEKIFERNKRKTTGVIGALSGVPYENLWVLRCLRGLKKTAKLVDIWVNFKDVTLFFL